jgi:hypothetical protein
MTTTQKIHFLTRVVRRLGEINLDLFDGRCGELSTFIVQVAKRAKISGVTQVFGFFRDWNDDDPAGWAHAWNEVDGRRFDATFLLYDNSNSKEINLKNHIEYNRIRNHIPPNTVVVWKDKKADGLVNTIFPIDHKLIDRLLQV